MMEFLEIHGGKALQGSITVSGAKNSVLPILTAALLTDQTLELTNVPQLFDVTTMLELIGGLGGSITVHQGMRVALQCKNLENTCLPKEVVRSMRASILALGPVLARVGKVSMPTPGGCAIGSRPVNFHLEGLKAMGAQVTIEDALITASAPNGLVGCSYEFDKASVTGTENLMMAATLAKGTTILANAACEPEVEDLANCLIKMGARISGAGTTTIIIEGVKKLHGAQYCVLPDRIETGTYMVAAAITRGHVRLHKVCVPSVQLVIDMLVNMGIKVRAGQDWVEVDATQSAYTGVHFTTEPYPGFPTDLQAQFMALNALATTPSVVTETIWENRFLHIKGLLSLGAHIKIEGNQAIIEPVTQLHGTDVWATDLRASAALVLAGLAANGVTRIHDIHHVDRGYECLEEKLGHLGAQLRRVKIAETTRATERL